jgi:hypothetical protein
MFEYTELVLIMNFRFRTRIKIFNHRGHGVKHRENEIEIIIYRYSMLFVKILCTLCGLLFSFRNSPAPGQKSILIPAFSIPTSGALSFTKIYLLG